MASLSSLKQFPSFVDQDLNLPAPGAIDHIDDDDDSDRYELWTFRIPSSMNVSDLNGVELDSDVIGSNKSKRNNGMKINDGKFAVSRGDSVENENFRVLVPNQQQHDSDDDDSSSDNSDSESNKFLLRPSRRAFTKHFNVHSTALLRKSEAELAPLVGPEPTGDDVLRHAYSRIPQKKGLKRRWMPLGVAPRSAKDIPQALVTLREEDKHSNVSGGVNAAAAISSDDDANNKKRRKSSGGKRRKSKQGAGEDANAAGEGEHADVDVATPKKKRVKKEKGSKSAEKSAKKSAKKQRKQLKREDQDYISM